MNFRTFVQNPVKVSMLFLALVLLGVLSFRKLPLNLFPDIQTHRITIVLTTEGLTPEETERNLTPDIERQMASIKGVSDVTSYSREGSIVFHVDFHWDQDMEFAYLDVKKNAGTIETMEHVKKVEVYRFDPNAAPLMTLAFTPQKKTGPESSGEKDAPGNTGVDRISLSSLVENTLKPRMETIKGVAYVRSNGLQFQEVVLLVNEDIMTQYDLTAEKVMAALKNYNISATGGYIIEGNEKMVLKFVSRFRSVEDIKQCVVTMVGGNPIHLADVGELRIEETKDEILVRQDGAVTISLDVFREPDANAVQTARLVRQAVQELNRRGGFGLKIAVDRSVEVEDAISELVNTAIVGMFLAILILWVFLRNTAATLVTSLSIPVSILATFSVMYFQSLSLNIMTLGGLALGAGMLVDNSIVVIENIFRHRKEGKSPNDAACIGTREVALAITAATLTTIVVFVPLVYVQGIAGILFKDQALTVVYSLLVSLLVALVLVPMLAARIAPARAADTGPMTRGYGRFLEFSLRSRWFLFFLFLIIMGATWWKAGDIPTRFFPESVGGRLSLLLEMPLGTPLERTEAIAARVEAPLLQLRYRDETLAPLLQAYESWEISNDTKEFLVSAMEGYEELEKKRPEHPVLPRIKKILFPVKWQKNMKGFVEHEKAEKDRKKAEKTLSKILEPYIIVKSVTTTAGMESGSISAAGERIYGPHTARMEVVINPKLLREVAAEDIINLLRSRAGEIPDLKASFESRNEYLQQLLGRERGDVAVEVHAEDLSDLRASTLSAAQALEGMPGLVNVRNNLVLGEESYFLEPDRDAMLRGQYNVEDLRKQIQAYLQGDRSDQVKLDQGEMGIVVKSPRAEREGLDGLLNLTILSASGSQEKLQNLVRLRRERSVREIMRVNQEKTLLVMADLEGIRYQDAVEQIRKRLDGLPWLSGAYWNQSGEEVKRRESFDKLLFALIIALVLVYMVIAAILESIIHPLTIMISVPMAMAGVVAGFVFTGISMNIMGYIGIVALAGIVVNNAIVLFDRINQIRQEGKEASSVFDAVVLAGQQRLRPILMTSLTTILALIPLAMGIGSGAELRRPLAVAVMGGLTSSTLLTLWIMPALYLCVEDVLGFFRNLFKGRKPV